MLYTIVTAQNRTDLFVSKMQLKRAEKFRKAFLTSNSVWEIHCSPDEGLVEVQEQKDLV